MTRRRSAEDDEEILEDENADEPKGLGHYLSGKALQKKLEKDRAEWAVEKKKREARGEWWRRPPVRTGAAQFTVAIRAPDDPERKPRPKKMADDPGHSVKWKSINNATVEDWSRAIVKLLSDGKSRTFNAISVELSGTTGDITIGRNPEKGLWLAVERGELEYTPEAPILFRATRRRGRTVESAPQKRVRGFAVYDNSTIKKQREGQRIGPTLLLPKGADKGPRTLEEARKIARDWTVLTGHSTSVKEDGIPIAHYSWNAEMSATYTKGWVRGKTAVTNGERYGIFQYARPSSGAADSGYLAGVVWDGEKGIDWVPLTSLTKVPKVPAKEAPAKKPRTEKPRQITAEHITDPVLGGAERRLAESVQDAIRLYGSPRKRR